MDVSKVEVEVSGDEGVRGHGQEGGHWDGQQGTGQLAGLPLLVSLRLGLAVRLAGRGRCCGNGSPGHWRRWQLV